MATIKCPECNQKISTHALSCSKCGRTLNMSSSFNDFSSPDAGLYTSDGDINTQNTQWKLQNKLGGYINLFRKNKDKKPNQKSQTTSFENGNVSSRNISKEEIYTEKKKQLKYWQKAFENEKQMHENHISQHNAFVNAINEELGQIQQQMQTVRKNTKKSRLIFLIFSVVLTAFVGVTTYMLNDYHSKELEEYQQQLQTQLSEHTSEIERQKQDLQLQIETLTQKLDSLK